MRATLVIASAFLALLTACAGASYQKTAMPDTTSAVRADSTRIYVGRRDQATGSWRNVRVYDNDREVGVLGDGEYLCWDRPVGQGAAHFIFDGLEGGVEGFCELPAEAGGTVYIGVTIDRDKRKPTAVRVTEDEGRAALAKRKPAAPAK